ncbi:hypothetical protein J3R82DRAFT_8484 [Butyriboletus roseoflavus]|nr:hypothetical protein J3R82DRAFT_8484 [Butyriboletus roseoflavus]
MPRTAELTSESETDHIHAGSTKKTYASKKRRAVSASESDAEEVEKEMNEEPEETAPEGDEDDEGEEEYEIEKILDAKKGQFPGGRMGYFVKWKNYGDEHNSWVDERDAGNAKELIERFWEEKKKGKPGPRKSEPVKSKPKLTEKLSRKSLIDLDSSVEPDSLAKKRGRPKKDELVSDKLEARDEDESEQRAKKKPRKSNGLSRQENKRESDEETLGNMKKHMKVSSWEELIQSIDTVEREEDGELYVFFTLKSDKMRVRENSRICAEKFPQKLIMFYESNLRWKTEEDPVEVRVILDMSPTRPNPPVLLVFGALYSDILICITSNPYATQLIDFVQASFH